MGRGLRLNEACHLRAGAHGQRPRMQIRVEQGKGRKDRYTLLSPRLLEELRTYWRDVSARGAGCFSRSRDRAAAHD